MRLNPYQHLLIAIKKWCHEVKYPEQKELWYYPKSQINTINESDIYRLNERVIAAGQLGYEVYVFSDDVGLHYKYRKKMPEIPFEWRY